MQLWDDIWDRSIGSNLIRPGPSLKSNESQPCLSWRNDFRRSSWKICRRFVTKRWYCAYTHAILNPSWSVDTFFSVFFVTRLWSFLITPRWLMKRKERKKEKKTESTYVHIHFSSFMGFGDNHTRFTPSIMSICTHFSKSIIGSCARRWSMKEKLSTGIKFCWCWNGFIHRLIITRSSTFPNPFNAMQHCRFLVRLSVQFTMKFTKLIHKKNFWFLNYPPKRGNFFFVSFKFFSSLSSRNKWLTLEKFRRTFEAEWRAACVAGSSNVIQKKRPQMRAKQCTEFNEFISTASWFNLLWFRTLSRWMIVAKMKNGLCEKMWRGGRGIGGKNVNLFSSKRLKGMQMEAGSLTSTLVSFNQGSKRYLRCKRISKI